MCSIAFTISFWQSLVLNHHLFSQVDEMCAVLGDQSTPPQLVKLLRIHQLLVELDGKGQHVEGVISLGVLLAGASEFEFLLAFDCGFFFVDPLLLLQHNAKGVR